MLTQSKEDFRMDLKIKNGISRTNSFTFSNISSLSGNQSPVDQQVSKLVKFVQSQKNVTVRRELETLLPPLVCHLFIEMLKSKDWRPAHEFLRKFSPLVGATQEIPPQKINGTDPNAVMPQPVQFLKTQNPSPRILGSLKHQPMSIQLNIDEQKLIVFRDLITNLSCIRRFEDVKDKLIINFLSCKYKAQLAKKTLTILNNFLSKHGHVLIIKVLHLWFSMNLYELHDESNEDTSSSSSDCTILNHFDHAADAVRRSNHKIDRFSDPSHCDNPKDIKLNVKSKFHHYDYNAMSLNVDRHRSDLQDIGSNMKLKRLRECLHRVDNKYHKPIRIFNINYTENR